LSEGQGAHGRAHKLPRMLQHRSSTGPFPREYGSKNGERVSKGGTGLALSYRTNCSEALAVGILVGVTGSGVGQGQGLMGFQLWGFMGQPARAASCICMALRTHSSTAARCCMGPASRYCTEPSSSVPLYGSVCNLHSSSRRASLHKYTVSHFVVSCRE